MITAAELLEQKVERKATGRRVLRMYDATRAKREAIGQAKRQKRLTEARKRLRQAIAKVAEAEQRMHKLAAEFRRLQDTLEPSRADYPARKGAK